jgi:hypothetical protein
MRCVMLLDCVAGSRHRFSAQLPICFRGRVSQNAELRGALRSADDKAAGDTGGRDVVIDDHLWSPRMPRWSAR